MKASEVSSDRTAGCLLGLAVGDAVGTSLEFTPPGRVLPIDDMVGGGPFRLQPGQWTDDTSMALCLADSIIRSVGFDAADQMQRYVRWMREGFWSSTGSCFDVGNTVRSALHQFEATGEPFSGSSAPNTAGNGSLMRLAPVPIAWQHSPDLAVRLAGESSRTTHGAREAVDACRYFAGLLVGALHGAPKERLLSSLWFPSGVDMSEAPLCAGIERVARGSYKSKGPPEIRGTGYVVESLEAALWAFQTTDNFREGCLKAANLGDDADTTAAIYGQLAGAYYGKSGIPDSWLARLHMTDRIEQMAHRLHLALSEKVHQ